MFLIITDDFFFMSIESQPCPDSHPYAINNRLSCCKYYRRRNLNGHPEMDGRLMTAEDPEEFCEDFILAPKVRPGATLKSPTLNMVIYFPQYFLAEN